MIFSLPRKITILFILLFWCCAFFEAAAQPGETRTFEEIETDLKKRLLFADKNIADNPEYSYAYLERGEIYYRLYENKISRKWLDDESYFKNAVADFTKAIELVPKTISSSAQNDEIAGLLSARARVFETAWKYKFYRTPETSVKERLVILYQNDNFTKAAADYKKAVRLASEARGVALFLSELYKFRGELYVYSPELLKEMLVGRETDIIWQDFDTALKYAELGRDKSYSKWLTVEILLKKGKVAFEAEKYDVALNAYLSDTKYLGKNYEYFCGETNSEMLCSSDKRVTRYSFSFRRAAVYVKLKKPEKALAEMEIFFTNVFHRSCPEPFLLRAEAYRQIGKTELAEADEKYARALPPLSLNTCSY